MSGFRSLFIIALATLFFEGCTVITEVDRDLVPDEPEAGTDASPPPAAGGSGGTAGSGGSADAAPDVAADAPLDVVTDAADEGGDVTDAASDGGGEAGVGDGGELPDSSMAPEDAGNPDADAALDAQGD